MTLFMKERATSLRDKFYVSDEKGRKLYTVEGEFLSLGKKLHIYDNDRNELACVQQKLLTLLPKYVVTVDDEEVAEITKELTVFKPSYKVKGPGWTVDGDIWDHNYKVRKGFDVIISVRKALFGLSDSYQIDIRKEINPVMAIAVVLAIDCVLDAEGDAAAAANNNG